MYAGSLLGLEDRAMTASWHVPVSQHLKSGLSVPSWSLLGLWMPRRREKKIARCSTATEGPSPSHWPTKPGELSVFFKRLKSNSSLKSPLLFAHSRCAGRCEGWDIVFSWVSSYAQRLSWVRPGSSELKLSRSLHAPLAVSEPRKRGRPPLSWPGQGTPPEPSSFLLFFFCMTSSLLTWNLS